MNPEWIADESYVALSTYKPDGTITAVRVWIADFEDGTVGFTTESSSVKVQRIRRDPRVVLLPCDSRGSIRPGSRPVRGTAEIVSGAAFERYAKIIDAKYITRESRPPASKFFGFRTVEKVLDAGFEAVKLGPEALSSGPETASLMAIGLALDRSRPIDKRWKRAVRKSRKRTRTASGIDAAVVITLDASLVRPARHRSAPAS